MSTYEVDKKVHREFVPWFNNRVSVHNNLCLYATYIFNKNKTYIIFYGMQIRNNLDSLSALDKDVLLSLAQGPFDKVRRFT